MLLPIAYYGNPVLRKKTTPVDKIDASIQKLVADMIETMQAANGIGLAAPQVSQSVSVFITCIPIEEEDDTWREGEILVYINPKILQYSQELQTFSEGCLSIPKLHMDVTRPETIEIEAMDLEGQIFQKMLSGFPATNFMHENDHLNGVLIIDRIPRSEKQKLEPKLREIKKKYESKK
jgi:peptide deformylase